MAKYILCAWVLFFPFVLWGQDEDESLYGEYASDSVSVGIRFQYYNRTPGTSNAFAMPDTDLIKVKDWFQTGQFDKLPARLSSSTEDVWFTYPYVYYTDDNILSNVDRVYAQDGPLGLSSGYVYAEGDVCTYYVTNDVAETMSLSDSISAELHSEPEYLEEDSVKGMEQLAIMHHYVDQVRIHFETPDGFEVVDVNSYSDEIVVRKIAPSVFQCEFDPKDEGYVPDGFNLFYKLRPISMMSAPAGDTIASGHSETFLRMSLGQDMEGNSAGWLYFRGERPVTQSPLAVTSGYPGTNCVGGSFNKKIYPYRLYLTSVEPLNSGGLVRKKGSRTVDGEKYNVMQFVSAGNIVEMWTYDSDFKSVRHNLSSGAERDAPFMKEPISFFGEEDESFQEFYNIVYFDIYQIDENVNRSSLVSGSSLIDCEGTAGLAFVKRVATAMYLENELHSDDTQFNNIALTFVIETDERQSLLDCLTDEGARFRFYKSNRDYGKDSSGWFMRNDWESDGSDWYSLRFDYSYMDFGADYNVSNFMGRTDPRNEDNMYILTGQGVQDTSPSGDFYSYSISLLSLHKKVTSSSLYGYETVFSVNGGRSNGDFFSDKSLSLINYREFDEVEDHIGYGWLDGSFSRYSAYEESEEGYWNINDINDDLSSYDFGTISRSFSPYGNGRSKPGADASLSSLAADSSVLEKVYTYTSPSYDSSESDYVNYSKLVDTIAHSVGTDGRFLEEDFSYDFQAEGEDEEPLVVTTAKRKDLSSGVTLTTVSKEYRIGKSRERLYSRSAENGTKTSFLYQHGVYSDSASLLASAFNANGSQSGYRILSINGVDPDYAAVNPPPNLVDSLGAVTIGDVIEAETKELFGGKIDSIQLVPGKSTAQATILDKRGLKAREQTWAYVAKTGGNEWVVVDAVKYSYNSKGLVESVETLSGETSYVYDYLNRLEKVAAPDGTVRTYTYDARSMREYEIVEYANPDGVGGNVADSYKKWTYDPLGRIVAETTGTYDGSKEGDERFVGMINRAWTYDVLGRLEREIKERGLATNYDYQHSSTGVTITETLPSAEGESRTRVTAMNNANNIKSITGTSVVDERYEYAFDSASKQHQKTTYARNVGDPRHVISYTDGFGRVARETIAANDGEADSYNETVSVYNTRGQLAAVASTGLAPARFAYDALGIQSMEIQLDENLSGGLGSINLANPVNFIGEARVTKTDMRYVHGAAPGNLPDDASEAAQKAHARADRLSGVTWTEVTSSIWPENDVDTELVLSRKYENLTGLGSTVSGGLLVSETLSFDANDNLESSETRLYGSSATPDGYDHARTEIFSDLYSNSGLYKSIGGFEVDSLSPSGVMSTSNYDALQRLTSTEDSRGKINYFYLSNTELVRRIEHPDDRVFEIEYDANADWVLVETNPDNKKTRYAYNLRGENTLIWGDDTYPIRMYYDSYGDMTQLRTRRNGDNWHAEDPNLAGFQLEDAPVDKQVPGTITRYEYYPRSGLLKKKMSKWGKDEDENPIYDRSEEYTYNVRGDILTREWHRTSSEGGSDRLTTTYAYYDEDSSGADGVKAGELYRVAYSNGDMPLEYAYNRTAQIASVQQGSSADRTWSYYYRTDSDLELDYIELPSAIYGSNRRVTYHYDASPHNAVSVYGGFSFGRYDANGNEEETFRERQEYDAERGRVERISSNVGRFDYSYYQRGGEETDLLGGYVATANGRTLTQSMGYEAKSNALSYIEAQDGNGTVVARFDYTYDAVKRVDRRKASGAFLVAENGGSYGASLISDYGYNDRNELTGAKTYLGEDLAADTLSDDDVLSGRHFTYDYDNIGNRNDSYVDGETGDELHTDYTVNALNQYVSRANPSRFSVSGFVDEETQTVTVAGETLAESERTGDFFYSLHDKEASMQGAEFEELTASVSGGVNPISFEALIKPQSETFSYDADGNLTGDSLWTYSYDAENRLISMEMTSSEVSGSDRLKLEFDYDYQGRRIRKQVSAHNGSGWDPYDDRLFYYRDFTLIGEEIVPVNATDGAAVGQANRETGDMRLYTWGLDGGSGGVGGLLGTLYGDRVYLPAYDSGGNVAAYVDVSDNAYSIAAAFEYDPFGNQIRSTGPLASDLAFRFSTKYQDEESGLLYYGLRFYSPDLGRFINLDPIGEAGGYNLYAFVSNNPVNAYDYLGLFGDGEPFDLQLDSFFESRGLERHFDVSEVFLGITDPFVEAFNATVDFAEWRIDTYVEDPWRILPHYDLYKIYEENEDLIDYVIENPMEVAEIAWDSTIEGLDQALSTERGAGQIFTTFATAPFAAFNAVDKTRKGIGILDELGDLGGAANKTGKLSYDAASKTWTSPQGLVYGQGSVHGNRVKHVLDHATPNPNKPVHSVFNVDRNQVIGLVDEAWTKRVGPGTLQSNGNRVWTVDMGRQVGTNGQTSINLVIRDGTTEVITAFPK